MRIAGVHTHPRLGMIVLERSDKAGVLNVGIIVNRVLLQFGKVQQSDLGFWMDYHPALNVLQTTIGPTLDLEELVEHAWDRYLELSSARDAERKEGIA